MATKPREWSRQRYTVAMLLALSFYLSGPDRLEGQAVARPLPSWSPNGFVLQEFGGESRSSSSAPVVWRTDDQATRTHTRTGLLIGGIVGGLATTVFLVGFCDDPDTKCDADEVGRAVLFIGVPITLAGALIGSLIRTER